MATTTSSRRAVLAGLAAAPVAAVPALALPGADAELLALGPALERAARITEAAKEPYVALRARIEARLPMPANHSQPEFARWHRLFFRALDRCGSSELHAKWNDAYAVSHDIAREVMSKPAHTIEGLALKADALEVINSDPACMHVDDLWELVDDIRRVTGKAVQQ